MTKLAVIPYEPAHLERIKPKSCHDGERPDKISGNALTIMSGETPLAIVGWYFVSTGVVQVWSFISDDILPVKKSFHKEVIGLLSWGFANYPIRRLQMSVRVGYKTGWRWARALGFQCEGVMKQYGPTGDDYWLFARTKV